MIKQLLKKIGAHVAEAWDTYDRATKTQLTEPYAWEIGEMENIFGLLVLGSFVGLPAPPMHITLDLMPVMEKELILMLEKVDTASSPLSDLASIFEVG